MAPVPDPHLAKGEDSIEAENYPLAGKSLKVAPAMKRTGPEDSRSRAEALHQLGAAWAYAGGPLGKGGRAVPGRSHSQDTQRSPQAKDIRDSDHCQRGTSFRWLF